MKKRRILSGIVSIALLLSSATTAVFAKSFSDVENDPTVAWAKTAITQMTDAGYIKGYEDGTYRPYRAISKLESLLLMARLLGAEESAFAETAAAAKEAYTSTVRKYNANYLTELTYLLYLGILTETDLMDYASATNGNTELLRHQAAILMGKLLGRGTEAKGTSPATPSYADNALIPTASRPYVEFVTQEGIMNGMDKTEDGQAQFSPVTSLTRAQMATLLSRMIARIDKTTYQAKVSALDTENNIITLEQNGTTADFGIHDDIIVRKGETILRPASLNADDIVQVIEIDGHLQMLDVLDVKAEEPVEDPEEDKGIIVYAKIGQLTESAGGKKITLTDPEDSSNKASYLVKEDCVFTIKGARANYADLKKNDFVKVVIEDGKIASVAVSDKDTTIEGTLTETDFDEENHVYLTVSSKDEGTQTYVVSNKGASVKRDGLSAEYRELSSGDKVTLTLSYGKVTHIVSTSNLEKFNGVISEIIIAKTPSVTILIDGEEENYKLRSDAKILVSGVEATVYDLRPGTTVNGTLDGNEIKTLSATTIAVNSKGEFTGEVVSINTTYKVITVLDQDDEEQSVYYSSKTTFLKSNGASASSKDVVKGGALSITGAENNGVFEATIIIVK